MESMVKNRYIIIEGIDHIGKTCFINKLTEKLKRRYTYYRDKIQLNTIKAVMPGTPVDFLDIKHAGILCGVLNMAEHIHENIIFDRLHLSGAAYAAALRSNEEPKQILPFFENELNDITDTVLITFILDGTPRDDDEAVDSKELARVNEQFDALHDSSILPKIKVHLRMDKDGITNILQFVDQIASLVENPCNGTTMMDVTFK